MFGENAGIKFDVTGDELRKHCGDRVQYHQGREDFYKTEEARFADEVDELSKQDTPKYSNSVTASNKDRMTASKNHHADRKRFFKFAAAHLKKSKYEMAQGELQTFEMIPS